MATNKDTLYKAMSQVTDAESQPDAVQQAMKQATKSATQQTQNTASPQSTGVQKASADTIGNTTNTAVQTQETRSAKQEETYPDEYVPAPLVLSSSDQRIVTDEDDQMAILRAKEAYQNAKTQAEKDAAQETAAQIRAKYGYSAGPDGSREIVLNQTDRKMSTEDQWKLLGYKNDWYDAKAKGDKAGMEAANKNAQALRAQYGYVANPVTGAESTPLGLFTDPNSKKQYVATVAGDFVRTVQYPVQIVDANGKQTTLKDANGNELTADMLVMGADGRVYIAATGQSMINVAEQYGIDDSNIRFLVNGKYYTVTGYDTTNQMGALGIKQWTDNDKYNELYQQLSQLGLERMPFIQDYPALNWEQALAQATQQLNGKYNKQLNDSLNNINRAALKTGFFGQLPTEALKAQATASTELERQGAINDLASTLMNDSRNYAQTLYEDDTQSIQEQMNVIMQLYNYLYKLDQDKINNEEDKTRLDQSAEQVQQTKQELLLEAAKIADQLRAEGFTAPQVEAWLAKQ